MNSLHFTPTSSAALVLYFPLLEVLALQRPQHGAWEWPERSDGGGLDMSRLVGQTAVGCLDASRRLFFSVAAAKRILCAAEVAARASTQPAASRPREKSDLSSVAASFLVFTLDCFEEGVELNLFQHVAMSLYWFHAEKSFHVMAKVKDQRWTALALLFSLRCLVSGYSQQ